MGAKELLVQTAKENYMAALRDLVETWEKTDPDAVEEKVYLYEGDTHGAVHQWLREYVTDIQARIGMAPTEVDVQMDEAFAADLQAVAAAMAGLGE